MKYKQICPECYHEEYLNEISDKVKVCPICNGYEIARQKIVLVEECKVSETDKATGNGNKASKIEKEHEKKVIQFEDMLSDLGYRELVDQLYNSILLKYRCGVIKGDFDINIESEKCPVLLGRSGVGQEYLQYDLRVSNEHCYIYFSNGTWSIRDNNSTNGTQVNGIPIASQKDVKIKEGDCIKLGNALDAAEFEVKINAAR